MPASWKRTWADLRPPVRRSARCGRAGHGRAGNAGGGARTRHAGDPGRRRRAGLRHGHGGARDQAGHRPDRGGGGALPLDVQPAQARRPADAAAIRWPKASRCSEPGEFTSLVLRKPARRFRAGQRSGSSKARWRCCCRSRRPWSKAPARRGWRPCWPIPTVQGAQGRHRADRAATSTRACSPTCCCAISPARAAWRGCG
jgi:hypothetical protein